MELYVTPFDQVLACLRNVKHAEELRVCLDGKALEVDLVPVPKYLESLLNSLLLAVHCVAQMERSAMLDLLRVLGLLLEDLEQNVKNDHFLAGGQNNKKRVV